MEESPRRIDRKKASQLARLHQQRDRDSSRLPECRHSSRCQPVAFLFSRFPVALNSLIQYLKDTE